MLVKKKIEPRIKLLRGVFCSSIKISDKSYFYTCIVVHFWGGGGVSATPLKFRQTSYTHVLRTQWVDVHITRKFRFHYFSVNSSPFEIRNLAIY